MKRTILPLLLVFLVAGCATKGQRGAEISEHGMTPAEAEQARVLREEALKREEQERQQRAQSPSINPMTGEQVGGGQPLGDAQKKPVNIVTDRSIYYDYNQYDIKEEFIPLIEAHAAFLSKNPKFKIDVQGNCDNRGSREYNLALGQKRADNVKRSLMLLGVSDKQIQSTSFGSEKPKAHGDNEKAWATNRRSDVVYTSAPR
jgi:peptidoglycan-associated lipoprotein